MFYTLHLIDKNSVSYTVYYSLIYQMGLQYSIMTRRALTFFALSVSLGVISLFFQLHLFSYFNTPVLFPDQNVAIILWWTPFGTNNEIKECGSFRCFITHNRTFEHHKKLKSILFYGSNFHITDLPEWRSRYVQWGLLHEESPRNNPMLVHAEALSLFNYSSTFSRFSDIPLTLNYLRNADELTSTKYFFTTKEKNTLIKEENLAPVLYIQSDCNTASNRDVYVLELMKHIPVDSYGSCINNRQLPKALKTNHFDTLNNDNFLSFVAKYKFTLAFENAICNDYITEKLWRPLIVGSVPVYYGSPSFKDFLPNNKSAISVSDFKDPKELANFLLNLSNNDSEYETYLTHKLLHDRNERIVNRWLYDALNNRPGGAIAEFGNYVEEFECFVCKKVYNLIDMPTFDVVTTKHYDCPLPKNPPSINKPLNWWTEQWNIEKCGAKLLLQYMSKNMSINTEDFYKEQFSLYKENNC